MLMHSTWFRSTFLRVFKFLQIKEVGPNFGGNQFCRISRIIWSALSYFNFKSFLDPNSLSFITFHCILHDARVIFSESSNLHKLKRGDLNSRGDQFCRKSELFDPPFCISILKILWTQILCHSLDFNAFWMIWKYFLRVFKFLQIKEGESNFWGGGGRGRGIFYRKSELFGPPFCISILKIWWTQILCHSLHFNTFFMIKE